MGRPEHDPDRPPVPYRTWRKPGLEVKSSSKDFTASGQWFAPRSTAWNVQVALVDRNVQAYKRFAVKLFSLCQNVLLVQARNHQTAFSLSTPVWLIIRKETLKMLILLFQS